MKDNFEFFWNGPLSQWYISNFVVNGYAYSSCEQYMMAQKAILFNDMVAIVKIMATHIPRDIKELGRQVEGFDKDKWESICRKVVFDGNYAKFSQNKELKEYLLSTGDREIVEASPYDTIWGIGLGEDDERRFDKSQWQGTNWLGIELMNVRETLKQEEIK